MYQPDYDLAASDGSYEEAAAGNEPDQGSADLLRLSGFRSEEGWLRKQAAFGVLGNFLGVIT